MKVNDSDQALAARLRSEREKRGWSLGALADRSGVSKAMISKIERNEASPTAALLGRLSGAFGLTLSALLDGVDSGEGRLRRAQEQTIWVDPGAGYQRRQISPTKVSRVELVEVRLPAGAEVAFPASSYSFIQQVFWALEGSFEVAERGEVQRLYAGDCLALGEPADRVIRNPTRSECRYLVAVARS